MALCCVPFSPTRPVLSSLSTWVFSFSVSHFIMWSCIVSRSWFVPLRGYAEDDRNKWVHSWGHEWETTWPREWRQKRMTREDVSLEGAHAARAHLPGSSGRWPSVERVAVSMASTPTCSLGSASEVREQVASPTRVPLPSPLSGTCDHPFSQQR